MIRSLSLSLSLHDAYALSFVPSLLNYTCIFIRPSFFFVRCLSSPPRYVAWGHSTVVDPWGKVIATTGHEPGIVYADIDTGAVDEVRQMIPVMTQRRDDLYHLEDRGSK